MGDTVLVDIPSNGFSALQCSRLHDRIAICVKELLAHDRIAFAHLSTFFSHVKSYGIGASGRSGIQVEIHSNQEISRSNDRASCTCHLLVKRASAKIRSLCIIVDTLRNALIFTLAAYRQILPLRSESRSLIAITRDVQLFGNPFRKATRNFRTLFQSYSAHWHNRQHIRCSDTGMRTMLLAHIDKLCGFSHRSESSLHHIVRLAHECYDCTISCLAWINIKQFHTFYALYCIRNLTDYVHIATFAEIRYTLYYLLLFCHSVIIMLVV